MNITKKIVASMVGLAMVFGLPALAETSIDDLLAQIAALEAQIAALQALLGQTPTAPAGVPAFCAGITFTANLSEGSSGNSVKCLQGLLNTDPATQVAASGAGSPGNETMFFGPLTKGAVVKFQEKYAAEILTPLGLTAGTGFVGASTRAKLNAMLTTPTPPTPPTDPTDPTTPPTDPTVEPTEGELSAELAPVPDLEELGMGASKAVMAFDVEAKDSEITISRVDFTFEVVTGAAEKRPWRYISYVTLYDGDNAVKGESAVSGSFEHLGANVYRMRISGLNIKVAKDATKNLTVKVTALPLVDSALLVALTNIKVGVNGFDAIRYIDTMGITDTTGFTEKATFKVLEMEYGNIELKSNTATPEEGIVVASDEDQTKDIELLKFDLKVTKLGVEVTDLAVNLTDASSTISYVKLYDGATLLRQKAATASVDFDNLTVNIAKDTTKTLTVKVDAKTLIPANEGAIIKAAVATTSIVAEDTNEEAATVTGSTVTGNEMRLYTIAPETKLISTSMSETKSDTGTTTWWDGTITFSVTAKGGDIVIATSSYGDIIQGRADSGTTIDTLQLVTIGGKALIGATLEERTIDENASKTFVASARITGISSGSSQYVWFVIDALTWNGNPMASFMLEDIKTDMKPFSK